MNNKLLVVQGRTLPQIGEVIQYFPDSWQSEFSIINKIGFDGIEWIYDKKSEFSNPILTKEGQDEMNHLSKKYNVKLENIVLDWFLVHPLLHNDEYTTKQKIEKLISLIIHSHDSKFQRIIFPLLENNSLQENIPAFITILKDNVINILEEYKIQLALETSLPPNKEKLLIEKLDSDFVKICFDMGNSASYGYDPELSIMEISKYLGAVHIKDRKLHGSTVPLGQGNVNFDIVFKVLSQVNFDGPISFQIYRDKNSDNILILKQGMQFINRIRSHINNES